MEIVINGLKYGIGHADTLKQSKHEAANVTIDILEPTIQSRKDDKEYFKVCMLR